MSEKIINNQNEQEAIWESLSYFDDLETEEISLTDELIFLETSRITDALVLSLIHISEPTRPY